MEIQVSRIPAVKAELEDLFNDSPDLAGVEVSRNEPDNWGRQHIMLEKATSERSTPVLGIRPVPLDESITLTLGFGIHRQGRDPWRELEEELHELIAKAEALLRSHDEVGGVRFGSFSRLQETDFSPIDKGRVAQATVTFQGTARI